MKVARNLLAAFLCLMASIALVGCGTAASFNSSTEEESIETLEITEKHTIIDDEYISVSITDILIDEACEITYEITNRSEEDDYYVNINFIAINGVQSDYSTQTEAEADHRINETVSISSDNFADINLGKYTQIEISFIVVDMEYVTVSSGTITIYPYGEEESVSYERDTVNDMLLISNDYVDIYAVSAYLDEDFENFCILLYLMNKTDERIYIEAADTDINSVPTDGWIYCTLNGGFSTFCSVEWVEDDLAEIGIISDEIDEIAITFTGSEEYSWGSLFSETVDINISDLE